jgi:hypothetical protein
LANLDFYNEELAKIQQELFDKLDNVLGGLTRLSDTEVLQLAKQIDFFAEMEQLGYTQLLSRVSRNYDDEITSIFGELNRRQLAQVPAASVETLRQLKEFELTYLTGQVRQYSDQLKNAMLRGIITGQTNKQIMTGLVTGFGVGNFISSSEASFLINDAFARFSSVTRAKAFEEFPEIKFQYVGPSTGNIRPACVEALKAPPLTREEIDAGRAGIGVNFIDRGGYNCRHDWVRV